jgi:hypothetical protein
MAPTEETVSATKRRRDDVIPEAMFSAPRVSLSRVMSYEVVSTYHTREATPNTMDRITGRRMDLARLRVTISIISKLLAPGIKLCAAPPA